MKHKALFTADLHGYKEQYKALFEMALIEDVKSIILGGDLSARGSINPSEQQTFFRETLPSLVKDFKDKSSAKIYLMLGNDDLATNLNLIEEHNGTLWNNIQEKRFKITSDYEVIGYSYVPISPFHFKDFEKFDLQSKGEKKSLLGKLFGGESLIQPGASLKGEIWTENGWTEKIFDKKKIEGTIEDDLNSSNFLINPKKSIYVFHCPPYETSLDVIPNLIHVGSKAIKNFIEKNQPYLSLTGHIHDTVNVTRKYSTKIGDSQVMTAGNGVDPLTFSYLTFDIYDIQNTKERKTFKLNKF